MKLYTAWRIDEKGVKHWLEGIVAENDTEAWDKGRAILGDWLKLRPSEWESKFIIDRSDGRVLTARPPEPDPVPDIAPQEPETKLSPFENECSFVFDENTASHFIVGALTPAQKAGVLVELLRGLQVGSVVGCLDLAADENPMILKLWLAQLEVLSRNKQMAHDEITVRSILGNPRD